MAYVIFFAWFCANTLTIAKVALFKHKHSHYMVQTVGDSKFIIDQYNPIQDIYNYFNVDTDNKETYAKLPYKFAWGTDVRLQYVGENIKYLVSYFSSLPLDKTDKILMPSMTNMLPILLKMPLYKGFHHWLHLNVTVNPRDMQFLKDNFSRADFVYTRAIDNLGSRPTFRNCTFYFWNRIHKRFVITNVSQYGLIYATAEKIKQYNLPVDPILDNSDAEIMKSCKNIYLSNGAVY